MHIGLSVLSGVFLVKSGFVRRSQILLMKLKVGVVTLALSVVHP